MSPLRFTPASEIEKIHERAREAYRSGRTRSISFRKEQLAQVGYMVRDNEKGFSDALKLDLGRPELETVLSDFAPVYQQLCLVYDNVDAWTGRQSPVDASHNPEFAAMATIRAESKGLVLIIGSFNFPLYLLLIPLISAIAGGNAAVLKPSAQTTNVIALLTELVPRYLDPELYAVINCQREDFVKILELRWDHILFIGDQRVGRIVLQAAAKHNTPLTLELGGKGPVMIDPNTDPRLAVKRILWGRFSNAGQLCLSPEYVLVPEWYQDTLVGVMKEVYHAFYPEGPAKSESFTQIVSKAHAQRLERLLGATKGTIVLEGEVDVVNRYVAPTVVRDVSGDDVLMSVELFGPVLMLVPVKDVDEAISFVNSRDPPLAVYVFSEDKQFQKRVFENTTSGAAIANNTAIISAFPSVPTGGIGPSGYGYYGGKQGFEQFIHYHVYLDCPSSFDEIGFKVRYPPYELRVIFDKGTNPRAATTSPAEGKDVRIVLLKIGGIRAGGLAVLNNNGICLVPS